MKPKLPHKHMFMYHYGPEETRQHHLEQAMKKADHGALWVASIGHHVTDEVRTAAWRERNERKERGEE